MQLDRIYTRNNRLYRETAAGDIYVWVNHPGRSGLGELDGFFKKLTQKVRKVTKKIIKAPFELHKKVLKATTKTKFGRTVLRTAGVVFAPFTGGLSLAAAEAAARYGKTRYQLGLSRSTAFKKGAVGAAIGYVGGKGIQFGYGALTKPAITAVPGYAGGGFTAAGYAGPGAVGAASSGASVITGVGGTLKTIGTTIAAGLKAAAGALPLLQASGVLGKKGEQAPSGEYYDPYAPAPAPFESTYGSGGSGGGGGGAPSGPLPYDQETAPDENAPEVQNKQLAIGGAVALAGLLFFTTMKPKRGRR